MALPRYLLCLATCAAASAWGQGTEVWNVCLPAYAVPPYLAAPGDPDGLTQRLIQDSARRAGIPIAVQRLSPARCTAMLDRGDVQAIIAGATEHNLKTLAFPERAGLANADRRLAHLRMIWLKSSQSRWDWNGIEFTKGSVQSLLIGTLSRNQVARDVLERLGANIDAVAYNTEQLLAKVAAGRVDGAVMLKEEFELLRGTPDASLIEELQRPFAVVDYYLVFRRGAAAPIRVRQNAWWSAIAEIRTLPAYQTR
jgi:hypothetical protein